LALYGSEWPVLGPGRFTAEEKAAGAHWIGGWVDPRVGTGISPAFRESKIGRPASSPSLYRVSRLRKQMIKRRKYITTNSIRKHRSEMTTNKIYTINDSTKTSQQQTTKQREFAQKSIHKNAV
jgi:hypothetical protein